ncbi:MAG TPA: hypothetical protein PLK17_11375, partial [Bacteroidales bacterium]|nr:hypothetical protein [Bacteroidales bacterium]
TILEALRASQLSGVSSALQFLKLYELPFSMDNLVEVEDLYMHAPTNKGWVGGDMLSTIPEALRASPAQGYSLPYNS